MSLVRNGVRLGLRLGLDVELLKILVRSLFLDNRVVALLLNKFYYLMAGKLHVFIGIYTKDLHG